jgi:hypothetical protein
MFDTFADGLASASLDPALVLFASASGLPPLPSVQAGVYYVRSDGSLTADGQTRAFLTLDQANAVPAGSIVFLWGGETFLCPAGGSLTGGAGTTFGPFGVGVAAIKANGSGGIAAVVLNGAKVLPGISVVGDGGGTFFGVEITTGPGAAFKGSVGGFYKPILSGNTDIGGADLLLNGCASPDLAGAVIGGTTPDSPDDNGIFTLYATGKIGGFTVQNIGGNPVSPQQTGFGIHVNYSFNGPNYTAVPLVFANGVPTNASLEIHDFIIHDCGWNLTNTSGGGNSGVELGVGGGVYLRDFKIYNVRPNPATFQGGSDFTPLDLGDSGAQYNFAERGIVWDCYGGLEDYNGGGAWGPSTGRYILSINCGFGATGSLVLSDNFNGGTHNFYNCTFVQVIGAGQFGSAQNLRLYQMKNANGILANCAFVTLYPYYAALTDTPIGAGFTITNNGFFGAGAGFNIQGTVTGYVPAVLATNALTSDPMFVGTAGSYVSTDYDLKPGSPYRGAGKDMSTLFDVGTTDLGGNPVKPGTPPNIGAFAFSP